MKNKGKERVFREVKRKGEGEHGKESDKGQKKRNNVY